MKKVMRPIEVSSAEDGGVILCQPDVHMDESEAVHLSRDQLPIVIQWLREAAGLAPEDASAQAEPAPARSQRQRDVMEMARQFRQLEALGAGRDDEREHATAFAAIRVALEWAAGESELSPREWIFKLGGV